MIKRKFIPFELNGLLIQLNGLIIEFTDLVIKFTQLVIEFTPLVIQFTRLVIELNGRVIKLNGLVIELNGPIIELEVPFFSKTHLPITGIDGSEMVAIRYRNGSLMAYVLYPDPTGILQELYSCMAIPRQYAGHYQAMSRQSNPISPALDAQCPGSSLLAHEDHVLTGHAGDVL